MKGSRGAIESECRKDPYQKKKLPGSRFKVQGKKVKTKKEKIGIFEPEAGDFSFCEP